MSDAIHDPAQAQLQDWEPYVEAMTRLHRLPLDAARKQAVVQQLANLETMARRFVDFPLEPEIEIAPVFRP